MTRFSPRRVSALAACALGVALSPAYADSRVSPLGLRRAGAEATSAAAGLRGGWTCSPAWGGFPQRPPTAPASRSAFTLPCSHGGLRRPSSSRATRSSPTFCSNIVLIDLNTKQMATLAKGEFVHAVSLSTLPSADEPDTVSADAAPYPTLTAPGAL